MRVGEGARELVRALRADHATVRRYAERYPSPRASAAGSLPADLVRKVGLQILAAYRVMRFARGLGLVLVAQVLSRLIRHLYGSDIHWDAEIAPGVMVVHGMGLCINGGARVARGAILFQNVTLGEGIDPETREVGAPAVGEDVQLGPGATLLGPITVGAGTKVMAGCVVVRSVPEGSLVEAAAPRVVSRKRAASAPVLEEAAR